MLEHVLLDAGFTAGSAIADSLSTYGIVKKSGIDCEADLEIREGMRREGIEKHLVKNAAYATKELLKVGAVLYGIDYLLGIDDNALNLHHAFLYGASGLKYLAALGNTLSVLNMERASNAVTLPVHLFLKTVAPLVDKTVGRQVKIGRFTIPPFFSFGKDYDFGEHEGVS